MPEKELSPLEHLSLLNDKLVKRELNQLRTRSIGFKESCEKLPAESGLEQEIAKVTLNSLAMLSGILKHHEGVYPVYASVDILGGLSFINHKDPQEVIAQSLLNENS